MSAHLQQILFLVCFVAVGSGKPHHPVLHPLAAVSVNLNLESISPAAGPVGGGTNVTVIGSGFMKVSSCVFGENVVDAVIQSDSKLVCESPSNDDATTSGGGIVNLYLSTDGGLTATDVNAPFKYYVNPIITRVAPREGPMDGGYMMTVLGKGLNALDPINPAQGKCRFQGTDVDVEIDNILADGKMLQCKTPPATGAGLVGPIDILVALNGQNFVGALGENKLQSQYKYSGAGAIITPSPAPTLEATPQAAATNPPAAPKMQELKISPRPNSRQGIRIVNPVQPSPSPEMPCQEFEIRIDAGKLPAASLPKHCVKPPVPLPNNGTYERGLTTLTFDAPVGTVRLQVASTFGFEVGRTIMINNMGNQTMEYGVITGFGSILLRQGLRYAHSKGEPIQQTTLAAVGRNAGKTAADSVERMGPLQMATILVGSITAIYIFVGFLVNRCIAGKKGTQAVPFLGSANSMYKQAKV